MKKILLALAIGLISLSPAYASENAEIVYYEDYDLDERVGLKEKKEVIDERENKNSSEENFTQAKIVSVTDGDTVTARINNKDYKLRMIGVDTPETVHPSKPVAFYGKEASDFTKSNLTGKTVYLEKDVSERDKYNRLLRYVWLSKPANPKNPSFEDVRDKMFNGILLRNGYANLATFPPDVKYLNHFQKIARTAERDELGLYNKALRDKFEGNITSPSKEETSEAKPSTGSNQKGKYVGDGDIPIVNQKIARVSRGKSTYLADVTWGPVKANMSSGKYHTKGQQGYDKISIDNVTWFSSAKAAEAAGYVAAKK